MWAERGHDTDCVLYPRIRGGLLTVCGLGRTNPAISLNFIDPSSSAKQKSSQHSLQPKFPESSCASAQSCSDRHDRWTSAGSLGSGLPVLQISNFFTPRQVPGFAPEPISTQVNLSTWQETPYLTYLWIRLQGVRVAWIGFRCPDLFVC